jgi:hypothetical protein
MIVAGMMHLATIFAAVGFAAADKQLKLRVFRY